MKKALITVAALALAVLFPTMCLTGCLPEPAAPTATPTQTPTASPTGGIHVTDGGGSVVTWGPAPTPTADPDVETLSGEPVKQTIISKASGKVLTVKNGAPALKTYSFEPADEFNVVTDGDRVSLFCLEGNVPASVEGSGVWQAAADEVGWTTLRNTATGQYLLGNADGTVRLAGELTGTKADFWYFNVPYSRNAAHSDMSWMDGCFGVFHHLLPDASTRRNLAKRLDTAKVAEQLHEVSADFYVLTIGQHSGIWNTENKMFSSLVTFQPDKRFTSEDIISRTARELQKYNIRLIVYCIPNAPMTYTSDLDDFGFKMNDYAEMFTVDAAMLWSLVLKDWAETYGDLISGWWFDGCYPWCEFTDDIAWIYASALKSVNPNAGVAFNENVTDATGNAVRPWVSAEDFSCGETNNPLGDPESPSIYNNPDNWIMPREGEAPKTSSGSQYFLLTYLATWWLDMYQTHAVRYSNELWAQYAKAVTDNHGCVAFDTAIDAANGYIITDEAMAALRAIGQAVHGAK